MTFADARVVLGDPLLPGSLDLTQYPFTVFVSAGGSNFDLGNSEPITQTLQSALQDGSLVQWLRDDNRKPVLVFGVEGDSLNELSTAVETLVVPFVAKRTLLTILPPEVGAEPIVFEVHTSRLRYITDFDQGEIRRERVYAMDVTAQPYARSLFPVITPAIQTGAGAPVVLDNGSGGSWVSSLGGSVTASGGLLSFPLVSIGGGKTSIRVTKTIASRNFATTPQIYIDLAVPAGATLVTAVASVSGAPMLFSNITTPSPGVTRYWFTFAGGPPGSGTTVTLRWDFTGLTPGTMSADNLTTTGPPPVVGSNPIRNILIQGSQRTPASLRVANCTLVYSATGNILQTGYDPATILSTGGSPTPVFVNTGSYVLVLTGKLTYTGPGSAGDPFSIIVTTTFTQGSVTKVVKKAFTGIISAFNTFVGTFSIGSVPLPLFEEGGLSGGTITASVTISRGTFTNAQIGGGGPLEQHLYAFWMGKPGNNDKCALTIPKWALSGDAILIKPYTWIDTATIDRPNPSVWGGTNANKSDATNLVGSMQSWGDHQFNAGAGSIYVVGGQTDLTYYPRWDTFPVAPAA